MPSRFEPCGLAQLITLKYGTLPIVRRTGGLKDSIIPFNQYTLEGNGFGFENYDSNDMSCVIDLAINVYKDKKKVSDDLVNRYFELTLREGNREAFIDRFKVKFDSISPKKIRTINQRTLILWGENDELIPPNIAYQFQDDLPNDTLVILKNVGHIPMEESPDESLKPVLKFLENY